MKKAGWKSYFGAFVKGIAGAAGGFIVTSAPNLPIDPTTAKGGGLALGIYFLGNMLKEWGMAHKAERQIEATKENTEAVKEQ